jgi:vacuolar-type H+-ATPase subunit I/STV1
MPIARMAKVSVLAPREMREALLDQLHRMGTVHVIDVAAAAAEDDELKPLHDPFEPETRMLRLTLAKTDFVIDLLGRFEEKKKGMISGIFSPRIHLTYEEFMHAEGEIDLEGTYRELEDLDVRFRHAEGSIAELEEDLKAMGPWSGLDCPLGAMGMPNAVAGRLVVADRGALARGEGELEERCPHTAWEEVSRGKEGVNLAIIAHVDDLAELDTLLSERGMEQVQFNGRTGTIAEEMADARERLRQEEETAADLDYSS